MLSPKDEAQLRDDLCVILLEATTPLAVMIRVRGEERMRTPVYDPNPVTVPRRLQPCICPVCGEAFLPGRNGPLPVYCGTRCWKRAREGTPRVLDRRRYPAGQAS